MAHFPFDKVANMLVLIIFVHQFHKKGKSSNWIAAVLVQMWVIFHQSGYQLGLRN